MTINANILAHSIAEWSSYSLAAVTSGMLEEEDDYEDILPKIYIFNKDELFNLNVSTMDLTNLITGEVSKLKKENITTEYNSVVITHVCMVSGPTEVIKDKFMLGELGELFDKYINTLIEMELDELMNNF